MRIDIWSDIACPWCYLGLTRLRKALERFEHADQVEVVLHSFQLDPSLPEVFEGSEADYLAASKGIDHATVRRMTARVSDAAADDGLRYDFESLVVANSRRAHRLLQHAKRVSETIAWNLELTLFHSHFTDGGNVGDPDTLVRLAAGAGLDAEAARSAIDDPELDAAVTADVLSANELGIQGVPFFVLAEKYGISGAQPLELFEGALRQVWDELQPQAVS
jgi:predicted DsbA family dithiol-disulfide isomerase